KRMNKTILVILITLLLASCNGWVIQPGPTPFLPITNTPSVFTPTPIIIAASPTSTPQSATATNFTLPTATMTAMPLPSDTPDITQTSSPNGPALSVEILGCNTGVDVAHGMGEVTNAFVVLRNTGGVELTNLKTTLNALDEGREHPDKTVEVTSLAVGYKVTLKLTVDSTYRAETPIQVEVTGDAGLFQRLGANACKDIGVFVPNPEALNTPVPNNP
ncbi:MAG TPA: lipoprotein, partial [Anaerolineales bacterium]|nr:lipoprotein [Anaerolineales bacterium]